MKTKIFEFLKSNKAYIFSAILIYILILIPSLKIPFHSDDFSYFLQGISLGAKFKHYMGWCGRVIVDFTSSFLLGYFSHTVYEMINSLVFLIMLIFVSLIPLSFKDIDEKFKPSAIVLWFVFFIYWISNPNLGQTSFWIVGSVNYLWTIMWASIYIFIILYMINQKDSYKIKDYVLVAFFAFFSGLSTEGTAVSIVFMTMMLFCFYFKKKKILITGLIFSGIGSAILILAPGNFKRLTHPAFASWRDMSFFNQVYFHIFNRMPKSFFLIILGLIFLLILVVALRCSRFKLKLKTKLYAALFGVLVLFSLFVFIKSPIMPPRSVNTANFFLVLIVAILIFEITKIFSKRNKIILLVLSVYALGLFVPSYLLFNRAIAYTYTQHEIREEVIRVAVENDKETAYIPDWYFTKLLKDKDKFDMYRSGAMPKYYGIKNIEWKPATFNYAQLKKADQVKFDQPLVDGLLLNSIYSYSQGFSNYLVFKFNKNPKEFSSADDNILYVHLYEKNSKKFINKDLDINSFTQIGEEFYYNIKLSKKKKEDFQKINFGFYDSSSKQNSASFFVEF